MARAPTSGSRRTPSCDTVPGDRSAAFRSVLGYVELESPHGDREVEPELWTGERLRDAEHDRKLAGRTGWTTAAFTADGECAACGRWIVADVRDVVGSDVTV